MLFVAFVNVSEAGAVGGTTGAAAMAGAPPPRAAIATPRTEFPEAVMETWEANTLAASEDEEGIVCADRERAAGAYWALETNALFFWKFVNSDAAPLMIGIYSHARVF
jgi:hypothetical protein